MGKTILYIDGENLKYYIRTALEEAGIKKERIELENLDLKELLAAPLKGMKVAEKRYYAARLRLYPQYPETHKVSRKLILKQRIQKTNLEKLGFRYIIAGNVRPQKVKTDGKAKIIFKEKGVDVKVAIDILANACDKFIDTAILCSSDSDLQPVIKEVRGRGIKVIYLGFEVNPNKGLAYTTNRTILIRNSEIAESYKKITAKSKK